MNFVVRKIGLGLRLELELSWGVLALNDESLKANDGRTTLLLP